MGPRQSCLTDPSSTQEMEAGSDEQSDRRTSLKSSARSACWSENSTLAKCCATARCARLAGVVAGERRISWPTNFAVRTRSSPARNSIFKEVMTTTKLCSPALRQTRPCSSSPAPTQAADSAGHRPGRSASAPSAPSWFTSLPGSPPRHPGSPHKRRLGHCRSNHQSDARYSPSPSRGSPSPA
jgi:hypothetical protein